MANSTRKQPVHSPSPDLGDMGWVKDLPIDNRTYTVSYGDIKGWPSKTGDKIKFTRKWSTKIHDTFRAFFRRFQRNQREN